MESFLIQVHCKLSDSDSKPEVVVMVMSDRALCRELSEDINRHGRVSQHPGSVEEAV